MNKHKIRWGLVVYDILILFAYGSVAADVLPEQRSAAHKHVPLMEKNCIEAVYNKENLV